jgi:DNA-binding transcriptional LysR family regulator
MDYKTLQHVIALADEGSFVRAAEKVALTQSAVSRSVMALEQEIGVMLFDRTPSGARPTKAGRMFITRAREIVAATRALKEEVGRVHGDITGDVALGAAPAIAATVLPQLLAWCVEHLPRLRVAAKVDTLAPLCQQLRKEQIEFFITMEGAIRPDPDLELTQIGEIRGGGVFCRPEHPLAQQALHGSVDIDDLLRYPFAVAGIDRTLEKTHRALLGIDDAAPLDVRTVCDSLFVLQRVAALTDSLLLTSQGAMKELVAAGIFVELPIPHSSTAPEIGSVLLITIKNRSLSPAAACLIEQLRLLF